MEDEQTEQTHAEAAVAFAAAMAEAMDVPDGWTLERVHGGTDGPAFTVLLSMRDRAGVLHGVSHMFDPEPNPWRRFPERATPAGEAARLSTKWKHYAERLDAAE